MRARASERPTPQRREGGQKICEFLPLQLTLDRVLPVGCWTPGFIAGPPADGQEPRRHNFGEILRPGRPERRKTVKPFENEQIVPISGSVVNGRQEEVSPDYEKKATKLDSHVPGDAATPVSYTHLTLPTNA